MLEGSSSYLLPALLLSFLLSGSAHAQHQKRTLHAIFIDNSGSLEKQLPQVLALGEGVTRSVYPRGPVAVFNFKALPDDSGVGLWSGVGWSQDAKALAECLRIISTVRQVPITLLDVIDSMIRKVEAKASAEKDAYEDKVIILITDGEHRVWPEQKSVYGEDDERRKQERLLMKRLKGSGIKVYAVGLIRDLDTSNLSLYTKSPRVIAENFLRKVTKETGGGGALCFRNRRGLL